MQELSEPEDPSDNSIDEDRCELETGRPLKNNHHIVMEVSEDSKLHKVIGNLKADLRDRDDLVEELRNELYDKDLKVKVSNIQSFNPILNDFRDYDKKNLVCS